MAQVLSVNKALTTSLGSFDDLLLTKEWTRLDKGVTEHKYYAPGLGFIHGVMVKGGSENTELVSIIPPALSIMAPAKLVRFPIPWRSPVKLCSDQFREAALPDAVRRPAEPPILKEATKPALYNPLEDGIAPSWGRCFHKRHPSSPAAG